MRTLSTTSTTSTSGRFSPDHFADAKNGPRSYRWVIAGKRIYATVDQKQLDYLKIVIASKRNTYSYLKKNPQAAQLMWSNTNVVHALYANPTLLDDIEQDPAKGIRQLIVENPEPVLPDTKLCCCNIL